MHRRLKKMKDDTAYCRLVRMIQEMAERGCEIVSPKSNTYGVVCDDGIVLFNFEDNEWGVCMVKDVFSLPDFKLNLTAEQMEEFNGGTGFRGRYYRYREGHDPRVGGNSGETPKK